MACPVVKSGHIIGKKWSLVLLDEISRGKFVGFNRFIAKTKNSITPRILSKQLKELENEGIIKRVPVINDKRDVARYELTQKGREIVKIINEMRKWSVKWCNLPDNCISRNCAECARCYKN